VHSPIGYLYPEISFRSLVDGKLLCFTWLKPAGGGLTSFTVLSGYILLTILAFCCALESEDGKNTANGIFMLNFQILTSAVATMEAVITAASTSLTATIVLVTVVIV
jgi:hypothetical protein